MDQDLLQRIKVGGLFCLQFYKVVTGTFLSLFIPQKCGDEICSLHDNYENPDIYHKMVLYLNGFVFINFCITYLIELKRENWAITYFDTDKMVPDHAIKEVLKNDPVLDKKMDKIKV